MNEQLSENYRQAYLLTIRSYGTWLHGNEKGSVDRHSFNVYGTPRMSPSKRLKDFMKSEMKEHPVLFDKLQRTTVLEAVKEVSDYRGYELLAVNMRTNHLHAVVAGNVKPEKIINEFKAYATRGLRENFANSKIKQFGRAAGVGAIYGNRDTSKSQLIMFYSVRAKRFLSLNNFRPC